MGQRRAALVFQLALGLSFAASAQAQQAPLAHEERPPAIWYRASQQCPSDAEFMAKFAGNAVQPKLAEAGDHIDFLVTLVDSGTMTVGRLERQTHAGTVAIRELRDASCQRVAEGLALSLGLALEPNQAGAAEPRGTPPAPVDDDTVSTAKGGAPSDAAPPAPTAPSAPITRNGPQRAAAGGARPEPAKRAIGAAAGILYGLAPRPMLRGQGFVDLDPLRRLGSKWSARFGVVGALGSAETRIGSVRSWLLGGYAEGCPWRLGGATLSLRPCLEFELGASGVTHVGGARFSDRALWATPGAGIRASAACPYRLGLEAGAGVQLPLARSQVFAGPSLLYPGANRAVSSDRGDFRRAALIAEARPGHSRCESRRERHG